MPRAQAPRWRGGVSTPSSAAKVGLSTTFLVTQAQRDLLQAEVNLLRTTFDYESSLVNFEAVQQAPPTAAGDTVGLRGANIVPLPTPAPRGLFRSAAGTVFQP